MFQTVPLSIIRSFSLYTQQWYVSYSLWAGSGQNVLILLASCQQTCVTYTIAVCTVKNSWWWTEELSETCRVLFQKYIWETGASSWFYYKKGKSEVSNSNNIWVSVTVNNRPIVKFFFIFSQTLPVHCIVLRLNMWCLYMELWWFADKCTGICENGW